jgi:hypothetical protein
MCVCDDCDVVGGTVWVLGHNDQGVGDNEVVGVTMLWLRSEMRMQ